MILFITKTSQLSISLINFSYKKAGIYYIFYDI